LNAREQVLLLIQTQTMRSASFQQIKFALKLRDEQTDHVLRGMLNDGVIERMDGRYQIPAAEQIDEPLFEVIASAPTVQMRTCTCCKLSKPTKDFYKNHGKCKKCYYLTQQRAREKRAARSANIRIIGKRITMVVGATEVDISADHVRRLLDEAEA
jgi:hypothetical protein